MGIAVIEGSELIYYGVRGFEADRPAVRLLQATRHTLERFIARYEPSVLAWEKTFFVQAKASALLQVQEAEIKAVGRAAGLALAGYPPTQVRKRLCADGKATKAHVAEVLVQAFPELARYRGPMSLRRARYWLNMFDALAVAVVCSEDLDRTAARGRAA
jgi:Holliday junction resolvasome RuvABC endonuclease subunit